MSSLFNRVSRFGRSPQGQSMLQKAVSRFGGGGSAPKGRGGRARRRPTAGRARAGRKR
jgi:hypothetical protein